MDDLKELREMRAVVAEPEAERLAPARARLLAAARNADTRNAGTENEVTHRRGLAPLSQARRLLLVTAVGMAAAATVVVVRIDRTGGDDRAHPAVEHVNAAAMLERAAVVAQSRPTKPSAGDHRWLYRKYVVKQPNDEAPVTYEDWTRYDGKQIARIDDDGQLQVEDFAPKPGSDYQSPKQMEQRLRRLSTDPATLLAQIRRDRQSIGSPADGSGQPAKYPDAEVFLAIGGYLQERAIMPPNLEAALFRALAMVPGVGIEEGVDDGTGRKGVGVYLGDQLWPGTRTYLILAPTTYEYLGRRDLQLRDEWINGSLAFKAGGVYTAATVSTGFVSGPGVRV